MSKYKIYKCPYTMQELDKEYDQGYILRSNNKIRTRNDRDNYKTITGRMFCSITRTSIVKHKPISYIEWYSPLLCTPRDIISLLLGLYIGSER